MQGLVMSGAVLISSVMLRNALPGYVMQGFFISDI